MYGMYGVNDQHLSSNATISDHVTGHWRKDR